MKGPGAGVEVGGTETVPLSTVPLGSLAGRGSSSLGPIWLCMLSWRSISSLSAIAPSSTMSLCLKMCARSSLILLAMVIAYPMLSL